MRGNLLTNLIEPEESLLLEMRSFAETESAKAIVILAASGFDSDEICKLFSLTPKALGVLIKETPLKEIYDKYNIALLDDDSLLKRLAKVAIRIKAAIMTNPTTPQNTRNKVATEILERVLGKPCQTVKNYVAYDIDSAKSIEEINKMLKEFGVDATKLESPDAEFELVENDK